VQKYYQKLKKPKWSPPAWIFGPVWTVLYIIIAVSFGSVFYDTFLGKISWLITLPFALNLIFNFSFTYIQFGLKNNKLAAADIILVLFTILWAFIAIMPYKPWVVYLNIFYLLWVSFATTLQLTITFMNKR